MKNCLKKIKFKINFIKKYKIKKTIMLHYSWHYLVKQENKQKKELNQNKGIKKKMIK